MAGSRLIGAVARLKGGRWALAPIFALVTWSGDMAVERVFAPKDSEKGSIATYTHRSSSEAVFDLHKSYAEEAKEARESYLPIYHKDNELLYVYREKIILSAMGLPVGSWGWDEVAAVDETSVSKPAVADASVGLDVTPMPTKLPPSEGQSVLPDPSGEIEKLAEHRQELEALFRAAFRLLEPYYQVGVVADSEFPNEKDTVRVYWAGYYVTRSVSQLNRFSSLQQTLERNFRQFFFKTNVAVRRNVIHYILERLPPNLVYAKENDKYIGDISHVTGLKMVLIRRGDVLVRRGDVIDSRAYYAIRASQAANGARWGARIGSLGLLIGLMSFFAAVSKNLSRNGPLLREQMVVYLGVFAICVGGRGLLAYLPTHVTFLPPVAVSLVLAVTSGRLMAIAAGMTSVGCLVVLQAFNVTEAMVWISGAVTGAFVLRQRRRVAVIAAGVVVGAAQTITFEFCRITVGRDASYGESWHSAEAFASGLFAGVLALLALPFVERWLGLVSRGRLQVLLNYDHPLIRRLRDRFPDVFAHTVRVMSLSDRAAEAIRADRLLCRVGALFHDIGRVDPSILPDAQPHKMNEHAQLRRAHVEDGVRLAQDYRLPREVVALIEQHHGTLVMSDLVAAAKTRGESMDGIELPQYLGPKPATLEAAVVMVSNEVERAWRRVDPDAEKPAEVVEHVLVEMFRQRQFVNVDLSQAQIESMKQALIAYLEEGYNRDPTGVG